MIEGHLSFSGRENQNRKYLVKFKSFSYYSFGAKTISNVSNSFGVLNYTVFISVKTVIIEGKKETTK